MTQHTTPFTRGAEAPWWFERFPLDWWKERLAKAEQAVLDAPVGDKLRRAMLDRDACRDAVFKLSQNASLASE
jgi:hypothetical protein